MRTRIHSRRRLRCLPYSSRLPPSNTRPRRISAPRTVAPSAPVRLTDAQIDAGIRLKMAKSKIGPDKFRFKVQGGVATIEGKTDVIQHKGAATRMAKTAGAVGVNNHIEISDAAKEKASDNLAKGRRRAQIARGEPRSNAATPHLPCRRASKKPRTPATVQKQ